MLFVSIKTLYLQAFFEQACELPIPTDVQAMHGFGPVLQTGLDLVDNGNTNFQESKFTTTSSRPSAPPGSPNFVLNLNASAPPASPNSLLAAESAPQSSSSVSSTSGMGGCIQTPAAASFNCVESNNVTSSSSILTTGRDIGSTSSEFSSNFDGAITEQAMRGINCFPVDLSNQFGLFDKPKVSSENVSSQDAAKLGTIAESLSEQHHEQEQQHPPSILVANPESTNTNNMISWQASPSFMAKQATRNVKFFDTGSSGTNPHDKKQLQWGGEVNFMPIPSAPPAGPTIVETQDGSGFAPDLGTRETKIQAPIQSDSLPVFGFPTPDFGRNFRSNDSSINNIFVQGHESGNNGSASLQNKAGSGESAASCNSVASQSGSFNINASSRPSSSFQRLSNNMYRFARNSTRKRVKNFFYCKKPKK